MSSHDARQVYEGFEIASHSMTHPCLTDLPPDRLRWGIEESKIRLESMFNRSVSGFCCPFKACNDKIKSEYPR